MKMDGHIFFQHFSFYLYLLVFRMFSSSSSSDFSEFFPYSSYSSDDSLSGSEYGVAGGLDPFPEPSALSAFELEQLRLPEVCDGILLPFDNENILPSSTGMNADIFQYQREDSDSLSTSESLESYASGESSGIAESMAENSNFPIEPLICEIPTTRNKRRSKHEWTDQQDNILRCIVADVQRNQERSNRIWRRVSQIFNAQTGCHLTAKQCREHHGRIESGNKRGTWTDEEKLFVQQYIADEISFDVLCACVHRSKKQIMERVDIETKNKNPWSDQEINALMILIRQLGRDYAHIRKMMVEQGYDRTYQQIRCKVNALIKDI